MENPESLLGKIAEFKMLIGGRNATIKMIITSVLIKNGTTRVRGADPTDPLHMISQLLDDVKILEP